MPHLSEVSKALGDTVARANAGVVAVHGGGCEAASGIAWSPQHVVTAAHVVERESELEVTLEGERVPATLVGADPASDLAVLRVERELEPLPRADLTALRAGELALAVARGSRGLRARLGIVSRVGPAWQLGPSLRAERYVESDIAPTPGLVGSALVDASGALIGSNATGVVRGVLVALPHGAVSRIVDAIVEHGHVRRAKLGVIVERVELPAAVAAQRGQRRALIVLGVAAGGPAEQAGILLGDVLLAVGGQAVERVDELSNVLDAGKIGSEVTVDVLRAGAELTLAVKPEAR
jgi:S1-C subfamily serine protease